MRTIVLPLLAVLSFASVAAPAVATEAVTIRVDHSDLDLSKAADFAALQERVREAAEHGCTVPSALTVSGRQVDRTCFRAVYDQGIAIAKDRSAARVARAD